jgi:hypothetical protein
MKKVRLFTNKGYLYEMMEEDLELSSGINDRNNDEIFENDVVIDNKGKFYYIVFNQGTFWVVEKDEDGFPIIDVENRTPYPLNTENAKNLEVVGRS